MKRTYVNRLPKNEEFKNTDVKIKNGELIVEVEFKDKFEPKDGDFVYVKAGYEHIAIFNKEVGDDMYVHANWNMSFSISKIIVDDSRPLCCIHDLRDIRPATEREKKILIDQLAKVNKKWNPGTKRIENVRWRAKRGSKYYRVTTSGVFEVEECEETCSSISYLDYRCGNYFRTKEAAKKVAGQIKEIFKNSKA